MSKKGNKKPPRVPLWRNDPLQEYFDDGDGNQFSVAKLCDDTKDLKPFSVPVAALDISDEIWKGADMFCLANHCKKVRDADLSKPIIISWSGQVADGRHRIIKAIMIGKRTIKAVRMTWRPEPCRTKKG